MTITIHNDLIQGSNEWLQARCGLLTASEMKHIITPAKLQAAKNEKATAHLYELLAQRITGYVEPTYIGDDMLRGMEDEPVARQLYHERVAPVTEVGFITNDKWGFTIGYSPDGLVGEDGQIEIKSRRQRFQIETLIANEMPSDYMLQVYTGLAVTEREWCDFLSFSAGLPMVPIRVHVDEVIVDAIINAAADFEARIQEARDKYRSMLVERKLVIETERRVEQEMMPT